MLKDIFLKAFILMIITLFAGIALVLTHYLTKDQISLIQKNLIKEAEKEVGGTPFKITAKAYGGDLNLIIGIDEFGLVKGVKVLEPIKETPGLGTLILDKANLKGHDFSFLGQFVGKGINDKFIAKQDIVSITGATITSQAVASAVKEALIQYDQTK